MRPRAAGQGRHRPWADGRGDARARDARLRRGPFDVLVCTTIIESGLDIPNANTIIIARADTLGLAQLYQLRGRVGRSDRRAYAYLLHRRGQPLSAVARSGCMPSSPPRTWGRATDRALRPRDPRGGQHPGRRAARLHGRRRFRALHPDAGRGGGRGAGRAIEPEPAGVRLDLPGSAYLPDDYIADAGAKLGLLADSPRSTRTRMSRPASRAARRFGPPPEPVEGLFRAVAVRWLPSGRACPRCARRRGRVTPEVAAIRPLCGGPCLDARRLPAAQARTRCGSRCRPVGTRSRQPCGRCPHCPPATEGRPRGRPRLAVQGCPRGS